VHRVRGEIPDMVSSPVYTRCVMRSAARRALRRLRLNSKRLHRDRLSPTWRAPREIRSQNFRGVTTAGVDNADRVGAPRQDDKLISLKKIGHGVAPAENREALF
jgi:hypothetical protein